MSRKTAREVAVKMAFAKILGGDGTYDNILEESGIPETPTEDDINYYSLAIAGIAEHEAEIDETISKYAIDWRLDRMSRIDLCILRIAIWEMLYCDAIPHGVSINEAVELAKEFSGERSPAFINGILGSLSRSVKK